MQSGQLATHVHLALANSSALPCIVVFGIPTWVDNGYGTQIDDRSQKLQSMQWLVNYGMK